MADRASTSDALSELLAIQYRSLPMYLADATDLTNEGDARIAQALAHIVSDQRALSQRIGALIAARSGRVELPSFPMEFTDTHFLSLDYLLGDVIEHQREDIRDLASCVEALRGDAEGLVLAQEALGSEKAHLQMLEELATKLSTANR